MKATKRLINGNKGFVSFLLLFFFVIAGFAQNIQGNISFNQNSATEKISVSTKLSKTLSAATADADDLIIACDQFGDCDADDLEIAFFGISIPKLLIPSPTQACFTEQAIQQSACKIALYDLFCNWKLHLA